MEHRYSQRVRNDTKLFIYERGTPVAIGRCKNSSRYGLFVETDHSVYQHQPLEIEMIRGRSRSESKSQRMKCYVVHVGDNGFGVEIDEDHINLFGAIASTRMLAGGEEAHTSASAQAASNHFEAAQPRAQLAGKF